MADSASIRFGQETARVLENDSVASTLVRMRLEAPQTASRVQPAQFLQVQTDPGLSPFLRRPFSVLRVDRESGWLDILYDVVGSGTRRLQAAVAGDSFDLLGPLGRGYRPPAGRRLLMVAGGVGIVPLAFLAWEDEAVRREAILLMGAASAGRMPDLESLLPDDLQVHTATDDGSLGHHGFVTDLMDRYADRDTTVLTCGPHRMMAKVAALAADAGLPCYASLENHMACGFGACVGCTVEFKTAEREDGKYRRVCLEGPVLDAHEIVW